MPIKNITYFYHIKSSHIIRFKIEWFSYFKKTLNKLNKKSRTSIKINFTLTASACMFFCNIASATTFSFWAGGGYPGISNSAPAACSYLMSDYAIYTLAPYHTPANDHYGSIIDSIPDSDMYWCTVVYPFYSDPTVHDLTNVIRTTWTCPDGDSMDLSTGLCGTYAQAGLPDKQYSCPALTSSLPSSSIGNPINLATGNKYQEEEAFTSGPASAIKISQFYNSYYGTWTHSFSDRLFINDNSAFLITSDNSQIIFTLGPAGFTSKTDAGTLAKNSSGWLYTSPFGSSQQFNADGRLIQIKNANGRIIRISYNGTTLTVEDGVAKTMITEDYNYQMIKAVWGNIKVDYSFSDNGLNKKTNLLSAVKTIGDKSTTRTYKYDSNQYGKLTSIIDERGVQYATWTYDSYGRAISSQHAGEAGKVFLTYNSDGSTTVVNALGKTTIYRFGIFNSVKHIISIEGQPSPNCPESDSLYAYNDRGQLIQKTDAKGYVTNFSYNNRGLETSRTEAVGTSIARTTTTEWDKARFLPTRIVTPIQITSYTYDDQGRETSRQISAR
jgi:YD repeat-containing protein